MHTANGGARLARRGDVHIHHVVCQLALLGHVLIMEVLQLLRQLRLLPSQAGVALLQLALAHSCRHTIMRQPARVRLGSLVTAKQMLDGADLLTTTCMCQPRCHLVRKLSHQLQAGEAHHSRHHSRRSTVEAVMLGPVCTRHAVQLGLTRKPALVHEAAQLPLRPQREPALQGQLQPPLRRRRRAAGKGVAHVVHDSVRALQQQQHLQRCSTSVQVAAGSCT